MPANLGHVRMFYGNYEFSPVPLFTENVELLRDSKLDVLFSRITREFGGTLLGNPAESGEFKSLFQRKEALRIALGSGNQEFRILHAGEHLVSGVYPRVNGPSFEEGTWADRINYSFTMEVDEDVAGDSVQSFTESWSFDEMEDNRSVSIQHDLSAVGLNTNPSGINNAFSNARSFVLGRTGFANAVANAPFFAQVSGVPFSAYEELRSENHDVQQGSFGATERFILSSGNFIHTRTSQYSTDNNGVATVSINGNVRGLGRRDKVAYDRALSAYKTKVRPFFEADASGVYDDFDGEAILFTSNPESLSVTRNPFAGTIDYSVSFTDSPTNDLPSGIQDFTISVQEQDAIRVFASFGIMNRALGNVVQDVGTSTEGNVTIQGNAVGKPGFPFNDLLAFVEDEVNIRRPQPIDFVTLRPGNKQVTKDERNNSINFSVQWIFTKELSQVFGDASAPVVID